MDVHELLVRARNELDRRGLAKENLVDPETGGVCARGAFLQAVGGFDHYFENPIVLAADKRLAVAMGADPDNWAPEVDRPHVDFNNLPTTTKEDVLALFDRAIAATAPPPEDIEIEPTTREPDLIPA